MKKYTEKCFVKSFDKKNVLVYLFETNEFRQFKTNNFFKNQKLFEGKNIVFDVEIIPGEMNVKCIESKRSKFVQLWNYYIRGKF